MMVYILAEMNVYVFFHPNLPRLRPERQNKGHTFKHSWMRGANDHRLSQAASNLGEITPHLLMRPMSSTTTFPARWSSIISKSPM